MRRRSLHLAQWRRAARCGLTFLFLGAFVQAGEWHVGTVTDSRGGKYSSLRMDKLGNAHVSYCDDSEGMLRYSFWDHSLDKWFNANVGRCGGFTSLVLDSKQHPHISFPGAHAGSVVHVYWDGSSWNTQTAELHARVIDYYTSITLDANDYPSISYYEEIGAQEVGRRLRVVSWNGKFWEARTVDSDQGSGKFNFMATGSDGNQQIAYGNVQYESASLRYARWNGREWSVDILEGKGAPGTNMWSVAMALADNIPHIAYTDVNNKTVKYATRRNGKWEFEAVDLLSNVGYPDRNGIALDEQGNVYISYYDSGRGLLKVAHRQDRKWVVEVVDESFAGFTSSLQISQGNIWVTYASADARELKVARHPIQQFEQVAKPAEAP